MRMDKVESFSLAADSELVTESLRGNREAFGAIVARYQSLVCSVTYSATGDLARSEDLAQETFLAAWKSLRALKEPGKLKSWLCGIARNLVHNSVRREKSEPTSRAEEISALPERESPEPLPSERAISTEEQALMWRALAQIPETYREPMVLFYREQQSVERVAAALDLSEDAVKQRLSRGRKLLSEQMAVFVEGTLRQSAPGRAFTYGVLAALPMLSISASAATVGAAAVKGSTAAKTAGVLAFLGAILGPLAGVVGAWFGLKAGLDSARTTRERQEIIRFARLTLVYIIGFLVLLLALMLPRFWRSYPLLWVVLQVIVWCGYSIGLFGLIFYGNRKLRAVRMEEERRDPRKAALKQLHRHIYRSKLSLLGLPLIHVNSGTEKGGRAARAVGWIAIGDIAIGAIAFGGIAVGLFSMGGAAFGLVTCGGLAAGILAFGGFGLGYYVIGGIAVGMFGFGGSVLAWKMAYGGLAVAREIAVGGLAIADQANNAFANAAIEASRFMQYGKWLMKYSSWLVWLPIGLVIWQVQRARKAKSQPSAI